jgi:hypothetical protein
MESALMTRAPRHGCKQVLPARAMLKASSTASLDFPTPVVPQMVIKGNIGDISSALVMKYFVPCNELPEDEARQTGVNVKAKLTPGPGCELVKYMPHVQSTRKNIISIGIHIYTRVVMCSRLGAKAHALLEEPNLLVVLRYGEK